MQYSKMMIAALPAAASALVVAREAEPQDVVTVMAYDTVVATQVVTQTGAPVVVTETAGAGAPTDVAAAAYQPAPSAPAPQPSADSQPIAYSQVHHGHGHFHSSAAAAPATTVVAQQPPAYTAPAPPPSAPAPQPSAPAPQPSAPAPQPSVPASSAAAPSAAPSAAPASGSASSGNCPADTSGKYISPGVNGAPGKSMLDSINYIRRMYNPNANCLTWSDSLASASDTCAAASSESHLRMNSDIVSAPGYCSSSYYDGKLASSEFERSMIWMLCQSPSDPALQGTCSGKTAEAGCTPSATDACTGHHDAIVDAPNDNKYMGCGSSESTTWISCSFSKDLDAPAGY